MRPAPPPMRTRRAASRPTTVVRRAAGSCRIVAGRRQVRQRPAAQRDGLCGGSARPRFGDRLWPVAVVQDQCERLRNLSSPRRRSLAATTQVEVGIHMPSGSQSYSPLCANIRTGSGCDKFNCWSTFDQACATQKTTQTGSGIRWCTPTGRARATGSSGCTSTANWRQPARLSGMAASSNGTVRLGSSPRFLKTWLARSTTCACILGAWRPRGGNRSMAPTNPYFRSLRREGQYLEGYQRLWRPDQVQVREVGEHLPGKSVTEHVGQRGQVCCQQQPRGRSQPTAEPERREIHALCLDQRRSRFMLERPAYRFR